MKLMIAFLFACFLVGLLLAGHRSARRTRWLFAICLLVGFAYYFLHQI